MDFHLPARFARARIAAIAMTMLPMPMTTLAAIPAPASAPAALGPAAATSAQSVDELRTGCGGGITGGASGVVLRRDGELSSWRRSRSAALQSVVVGKDAAAAERIFRRASQRGFQKLSFHGAGNLTCWIEQTKNGVVHRVQWGDPADAPPLATELYEAVQKLQRRLSRPDPPH
jgi:hypothetical protein